MNIIVMLIISVFALLNSPTTWASDVQPSHTTIAKDFAVLNKAKEESKQDMKKKPEMKEKDFLYENILQSLNASKTKGLQYEGVKQRKDFNKKRGITAPLAYILNNHERKINERNIDNHRYGEGSADMLIVDNNSETAELNGSKVAFDRLINNNSANRKDKQAKSIALGVPPHMLPIARGSANVIRTHIVIPPQTMPLYTSSNPFSPMDQLMKMANMLMFKVGMDSVSPYRTQTTQMAFTPNMLMAPTSQHLILDDNHPNSDFTFNSIEGPESPDFPPLSSGNNNGQQSRTIVYAPPLIFKHPIPVDEPKQIINLIENALGTVLANTDGDGDDAIDVTCPIHHEKKSVQRDGKCAADETNGDGGVIQVCSCRLIKKGKNEANKEQK